ncbi:MAG: glycosyltransferase family 2 protein [Thiohalocapsa sp.]
MLSVGHTSANCPNYGERVSIIVPTFNRAHYIEECLQSLLTQSVPPHEIIVVDDGSEDDTRRVLSEYCTRIRWLQKENGGKPSAINLALPAVKGDLVWVFDDDDVALPKSIEVRIATLRKHPQAGFVYSPHYMGFDGLNGRIACESLHATPAYTNSQFFHEILKECFFHLGSTLVRSHVFREVGSFDCNLKTSEDYDFQIRLARHASAAFCQDPTFIFRQHSGTRGPKSFRYSSTIRTTVFGAQNRLIGEKLRKELQLGDYLVPRDSFCEGSQRRRKALFARMLVMASKGCIYEMLDDLVVALRTTDQRHGLQREECQGICDSVCTGLAYPAIKEDISGFRERVCALRNLPNGRNAIRCLSYGLIRRARWGPCALDDIGILLSTAGLLAFWSVT